MISLTLDTETEMTYAQLWASLLRALEESVKIVQVQIPLMISAPTKSTEEKVPLHPCSRDAEVDEFLATPTPT